MIIEGEYVLTIYGDNLDFAYIENSLGIRASKVVKKGEKKAANKFAPTSIWMYIKRVSEETLFEKGLMNFLFEIEEKKESIVELSFQYNVEINCYLRSEYGQFGYSLDSEILSMLNEFHLPINFHILSFGMVEE